MSKRTFYLAQEMYDAIMKKSKGKCWYCGIELYQTNEHRMSSIKPEGTIDHVIPLSKNGKTIMSNLVMACRSCNSTKSNLDFPEFLSRMKKKFGENFVFFFEKEGLRL